MARGKKNTIKLTEKQQKIVIDNLDLAYSRAFKYYKKYQEYDFGYEQEDYISFATIGLCLAARAFDSNKGFKFSTYAVISIDNRIKKYIFNNSMVKIPKFDYVNINEDKDELLGMVFNNNMEYFDKYIDDEDNENDLYAILGTRDHNLSDSELLNDIKAMLSEKEYGVIIDRIYNGLTYDEIAEKYGFASKMSANNMYRKYLNKIKDVLENVA